MRFINTIKNAIRRRLGYRTLKRVYAKYRDFTMIPERVFVDNLLLAHRARHIPGCVVECGVWRGGMCAGLVSVLGKNRDYYLFDSFEGLPAGKEIDGHGAIEWQKNTTSPEYFDNCSAPPEFAERAMALSGAEHYHLVKGWFDESLPRTSLEEPIALLRLDGDWYDSTMACLDGLFHRVCPGGIIVLDDYHTWDGCSRALHDFMSHGSLAERINCYNGICYIVKK